MFDSLAKMVQSGTLKSPVQRGDCRASGFVQPGVAALARRR